MLAAQGLVIVDGIFLFLPELDDLWTFRIWFTSSSRSRSGAGSSAMAPPGRSSTGGATRPASGSTSDAVRPAELADVILDNSDPDEPRLSPGGADRRS